MQAQEFVNVDDLNDWLANKENNNLKIIKIVPLLDKDSEGVQIWYVVFYEE